LAKKKIGDFGLLDVPALIKSRVKTSCKEGTPAVTKRKRALNCIYYVQLQLDIELKRIW
jgi:hypothetical protein